jgi:streptomycin 6-kinase
LSLQGKDDDAARIIGSLIQGMSGADCAIARVASVERLKPDFAQFYDRGAEFIPSIFVDRAEALFVELCATERAPRLLHGDLHHHNILFDEQQGWVVIDPWGAMGEVEFEAGASLRNPIDALVLLGDPRVLERRLQIYEACLGFDVTRALKWAFATTVLAILWPVGDGLDLRQPFARAARAMLQLLEGDAVR